MYVAFEAGNSFVSWETDIGCVQFKFPSYFCRKALFCFVLFKGFERQTDAKLLRFIES